MKRSHGGVDAGYCAIAYLEGSPLDDRDPETGNVPVLLLDTIELDTDSGRVCIGGDVEVMNDLNLECGRRYALVPLPDLENNEDLTT